MNPKYQIIFVTVPTDKTAQNLARKILNQKLAACVNIIDNIKSIYRWKGKIEKSKEKLLIIKTKSALTKKLIKAIKNNHPYDTPEIIAFDIADADKSYLSWIEECLK